MKKILAGFWDLMHKYEEALERGDSAEHNRYSREFTDYVCKYQKELKLDPDYVEDMRIKRLELDKSLAEETYCLAKLENIRRQKREAEETYMKIVMEEEKRGNIKWN
ncbi:hypothetical protein BH10ACI1_BH10ACI1_23910 [soil metagenome]